MASKPKLVAEPQFKIIKGAPLPSRASFPLREMEVGDAFDAPMAMKSRLTSAASWFGTRNGRKYSVRSLDENTIRCWRIA